AWAKARETLPHRKASSGAFAHPTCARSLRARAQLLHLGVRREHAGAVDVLEIGHRALAALERDLADEGAHRRLVVAGAILERPERALDLEAAERRDQLVGVGRLRLGDA